MLAGDRTVRTLFQGTLGAAYLYLQPPSVDDLVLIIDHGERFWRIREANTFKSRRILDTVSAVVHCAANNHNPWLQGDGARIPASIPDRCLKELNLPMPAVSLLRSQSFGPTYEMRTYDSREAALEALQLINGMRLSTSEIDSYLPCADLCSHFLLWMAYALYVSICNGQSSAFNFGAVIGMHPADFMPRVQYHGAPGVFLPLVEYMADEQHNHKMDFGMLSESVFHQNSDAAISSCSTSSIRCRIPRHCEERGRHDLHPLLASSRR